MATSQNPQLTPEDKELREQVRLLEEQELAWQNILRRKANALDLQNKINKAAKDERAFRNEIVKLGKDEAKNAVNYKNSTEEIKQLEKEISERKYTASRSTLRILNEELRLEKERAKELSRTAGGALMQQSLQYKKTKDNLTAERDLIKDINKQRSLGNKVMDLFRSKEERQRQIDIARLKASGGANIPPGGGGPPTTTGSTPSPQGSGANSRGLYAAALASSAAFVNKLKDLVITVGQSILSALAAPLKEVSNLVNGGINGGYGIGGGAVSGEGATSILGGFQQIAGKIPFIGGLLGGLIGVLKGVVDLVLGLDQGITNFARNLGISKDRAKLIKEEFRAIAGASNNIVVNETRLLESQAELTKALGIRSVFSKSILQNNIQLKELAGVELETRKAIAQVSVLQNRDAITLTKSILVQSKALEFQTGVAFEYRTVLAEASKQAGYLGLAFAKYPENLTKSLVTTKAMGYELKQLDNLANSFLNFESSISKEMEAQVLTGRAMNLTLAREAALNNDLVTLSKEVNQNVGSAADYLRLNRIEQDAIAESVGMTRDGLADVLKQQEYYQKLGATNLKQAGEQLKILRQQGLTQAEISKKIGEDAYNYITQTSTAERLSEVMNRIKQTFVEFVEKSGILDFITNPQKIESFAKGLIDRLAGAVEIIGDLIAGIVNLIGKAVGFFGGDVTQWEMLSDRVSGGSTGFSSNLRQVSATLGGMPAPSIGATIQSGIRPGTPQPVTTQAQPAQQTTTTQQPVNLYIDSYKVGSIMFNQTGTQLYGMNKN